MAIELRKKLWAKLLPNSEFSEKGAHTQKKRGVTKKEPFLSETFSGSQILVN